MFLLFHKIARGSISTFISSKCNVSNAGIALIFLSLPHFERLGHGPSCPLYPTAFSRSLACNPAFPTRRPRTCYPSHVYDADVRKLMPTFVDMNIRWRIKAIYNFESNRISSAYDEKRERGKTRRLDN